jgi:hypothetical protein
MDSSNPEPTIIRRANHLYVRVFHFRFKHVSVFNKVVKEKPGSTVATLLK